MDLWKTPEAELRQYVLTHLFDQIDPAAPLLTPYVDHVRIGAFTLDLLAANAEGGLTVVEFRTDARKEALADLLLYERVVRRGLAVAVAPGLPVRVVLVTPFLDLGVLETLVTLNPDFPVVLRVVVPDDEKLKLVSPEEASSAHVFDLAAGANDFTYYAGDLLVRGCALPVRRPTTASRGWGI